MATPFDIAAGVYQGRIRNPVNHTPAAGTGSWTYVLGHDLVGQTFFLSPNDSIAITQSAALNDADELRVIGRVRRESTALPAGFTWVFEIEVDGTTFAHTLEDFLELGAAITAADDMFGVNIADVPAGSRDVTFRLRLDGPGADPVEVELPAIYIDLTSHDELVDAMYLTARLPEAGDIDVSQDSLLIRVQIADTTGVGVDATATQVFVRGVLAYDGGGAGFQAGFSGTATAGFGIGNDLLIVIDMSAQALVSEEEIDVQVVSETTGGASTIDETYSFTLTDFEAPSIDGVQAIEKRLVRVVFNDDMQMVDATASNDALNPANYTFERTTAPAANVEAVSVTAISSTEVEIETDIALTFGGGYQLTIANVEDTSGNVILAPGNVVSLVGFTPIIPQGRRFSLIDMLPAVNRREDATGDLSAFVGVLQETTNLLLCAIDRFTDIVDIDVAPEYYVDLILCDLGNPFRFNLSLIDKRRLARVLVDIYREKGTCRGIINAVRFFLGIEIECDEFNLGDYWLLGESELGWDTVLAPAEQALLYSFQLIKAEQQISTVVVNGDDDGDYIVTINSEDHTFPATGNTIQEIRDGLYAFILANVDLPLTVTTLSTDSIVLTSNVGTAFTLSVDAPVLGNLTFSTSETPTPFTDEQLARIAEIADYMKPAHTHLVRVVQPLPPPLIDHWELGVSLLGETSYLHE